MSESSVSVDEGTQKAIRAILESIGGQDRYTPVVKLAKGSASSLLDLLEKTDFDTKFNITHSALRDAILGTSSRTLTDLYNTLGTEATLALIKAKTDNLDALLSTRATETTLAAIKAQTDKLNFDASNNLKIFQSSELPTYSYKNTVPITSAQNKHFISLFNATGSGKIIRVLEVYAKYTQAPAVTGVGFEIQAKRITAQATGGTQLNVNRLDKNDSLPPSQITARENITTNPPTEEAAGSGEDPIYDDYFTSTEGLMEATGLPGVLTTIFPIYKWDPQGRARPWTFREGFGLTLKQITNSTVGTWSMEIILALE